MTDSVIDDLAHQGVEGLIVGQTPRGEGALLRALIRKASDRLAEREGHDAAAAYCGGRAAHHHAELNCAGRAPSRGNSR